MKKTIALPGAKAAIIQQKYAEHNCELREFAVSANDKVKVTIEGDETDVNALLELIGYE